MKLLLLVFVSIFSLPSIADTFVRGHYKDDGTYVQPHHRSDPNNTVRDNWSTKGNINPYTGKEGTKNSDWKNDSYWDKQQRQEYRPPPNQYSY